MAISQDESPIIFFELKSVKQKKTRSLVAIVAGGTGGHIFPALEVAKALRVKNHSVIWLGEPNSLESKIAAENDFEFIACKLKRIKGENLFRKITHSFLMLKLIFNCFFLLKNKTIKKAIVFGGFVSFPFAIALKFKGVSLFIHEQNSIAGLANKTLCFFAKKIFVGFEGSFVGKNVVFVGNPVRDEILQVKKDYESFKPQKSIRILVFGGSLGSRAFNQNLTPFISRLAKNHPIEVIHQYGKLDDAPKYKNCQSVKCERFIENMPKVYHWADMVICRAGAMSVSEVEAIGVFTLFVPFPFAVYDHQKINAQKSSNGISRFVIDQKDLSEQSFELIFNRLFELEDNKAIINKEQKQKNQFYQKTLEAILFEMNL